MWPVGYNTPACDFLQVTEEKGSLGRGEKRRRTSWRISSTVRAEPAIPRVLGLGFSEEAGPKKEFSPMKSSKGPTVGPFPWEPG